MKDRGQGRQTVGLRKTGSKSVDRRKGMDGGGDGRVFVSPCGLCCPDGCHRATRASPVLTS